MNPFQELRYAKRLKIFCEAGTWRGVATQRRRRLPYFSSRTHLAVAVRLWGHEPHGPKGP